MIRWRGGWAWGRLCVACLWLAALLSVAAQADTAVKFGADDLRLDLSQHGAILDSDARSISVEVPTLDPQKKLIIDLAALGAGPRFAWTVHSITNDAPVARELVLVVTPQRFAGSGIVPLRPFGPRALQIVRSGAGQVAIKGGSEAYLRLEAGEAIAVALEGPAPMAGVSMMTREAYVQGRQSFSFIHGAGLGIVFVCTLFILGLYALRSDRVFACGAVLGLGFMGFFLLESGYLDTFAVRLMQQGVTLQHVRAQVESALVASLWLGVWGLTAPNRRKVSAWWALVPVGVMWLLLAALSAIRPEQAVAAARLLGFIAVIAGFGTALVATRRDSSAMAHGVLVWGALLTWVGLAVYAALSGQTGHTALHALLVTGIAAIMSLLAFALSRFAFAKAILARPFLADATNRSLALAGARHLTFDWRPLDSRLHVDGDLAAALGLDRAAFEGPAAQARFMSLVHQSDHSIVGALLNIHGREVGDYLSGDFRLQSADGAFHWYQLRASVLAGTSRWPERAIGTLTDITEIKEAEERLVQESVQDPVTSLPSRAIFVDRLEREMAKPLGLTLRVLHVGLSRFKMYNDGLGHDLGDQLLALAGQRIAELLKPEETLTRVSGSSFAVMFVDAIDSQDAMSLAETIVKRIAEPASIGGQDVVLSACVGISNPSTDAADAAELQAQAAGALHEAMRRGAGVCLTYDGTMQHEAGSRLAIETGLRRAINGKEIEVFYQPVFHLPSRSVAGFEALARWHHPERGTLGPAEFIAIAEQAGLIGEIGLIVLQEAARQLGVWQRTLARDRQVFVAVNVSADQLSDASLIDKLAPLVEREDLEPQSLRIEITESIAMRYPERARQFVARLKAIGVSVSCDDFGTGFSNLAALRDLQFDTLKMDKSFIAQEGLEGRGGIILGAVVSLAHQLGMNVIAEGIEDETQALLLEAIGVDFGQGFWLGSPIPARDVPGLLAVLPSVQHAQSAEETNHSMDAPDGEMSEATPQPPPPGQARLAPRMHQAIVGDDDEPLAENDELLIWPLDKGKRAPRARQKPKRKSTPKRAKPGAGKKRR